MMDDAEIKRCDILDGMSMLLLIGGKIHLDKTRVCDACVSGVV